MNKLGLVLVAFTLLVQLQKGFAFGEGETISQPIEPAVGSGDGENVSLDGIVIKDFSEDVDEDTETDPKDGPKVKDLPEDVNQVTEIDPEDGLVVEDLPEIVNQDTETDIQDEPEVEDPSEDVNQDIETDPQDAPVVEDPSEDINQDAETVLEDGPVVVNPVEGEGSGDVPPQQTDMDDIIIFTDEDFPDVDVPNNDNSPRNVLHPKILAFERFIEEQKMTL